MKPVGSKISTTDLIKLLKWELNFLLETLIKDIQESAFLEHLSEVTALRFLNDFNAMFYCCPTEAVTLPSVYFTVKQHKFFWNNDVALRNDAEDSEEADSDEDSEEHQDSAASNEPAEVHEEVHEEPEEVHKDPNPEGDAFPSLPWGEPGQGDGDVQLDPARGEES